MNAVLRREAAQRFHETAQVCLATEAAGEGIILQRLFTKLEEIRIQLGDRVFDVVGQLLSLNELRLEEMLREAAINPARIEEYTGQIERLSTEQL